MSNKQETYATAFFVAARQRDVAMAALMGDFYKARAEIEAAFAKALAKAAA